MKILQLVGPSEHIEFVPAAKLSKNVDVIPVAIPVGVPVAVPAADKNASKKVGQNDTTSKEFTTVMKRMAELEEKMTTMNHQPATMPPEKEEMLNATISRADVLEKQLMDTKKALEDSLAKQEVLSAYVEKKKQKKKTFFCC
uniref:Late nodulin Nlj16 n=1 Tax=Lotus japonicus TaxID=34305 RepID=O04360_LOTJA|nr:late nodulin Nlj16 [Lotus japonicus]AFK43268.1 unknown [Lotus japonicus]